MSTKPIDTFILNSVDLFKINPSQSAISITYQPPKVTAQPIDSSKNSINNNLPKITFKTNNPHLSSTYKYKTNKNKDVSRLLNSIGPNGVSIIPNGILKRKTKNNNNNNKNSNKKVALITGLSTLIINNKIPEFKSTNITNNNNKDITKKKKKNNSNNNKNNKNKR
ncbi:signal recognition particle subunit Srp21p [Monosporozyma servazzii]